MAEDKRPDYTDADWRPLIEARAAQWAQMWQDIAGDGLQVEPLWQDGAEVPGFKAEYGQPVPRLALFPVQREKRGAIIVNAGGGFLFKSPNEARPVAEAFHRFGFNAAILDYRTAPYGMEDARQDGLRAIRWLRCHAPQLGIDAEHIGMGGFSAGGILTSMVNNSFNGGVPAADDPVERVSSRPDAAFQMYGSFAGMPRLFEAPRQNTLGYSFEQARHAARENLALMLPLDAPPIFMAQTDEDDPMLVLNMARAYLERGIRCEYHLFHGGPHGGGLFDGSDENTPLVPHTAHWMELCCEWFAQMGF